MKRVSLAIVFACCTLALAAQDAIRVNYKGAKPTIVDFASAFLFSHDEDEDECDQEATGWVEYAISNYLKGEPQEEWVTLTVDEKNGYICCESRHEDYMIRAEMCYWNESDGKHKLFAYSSWLFQNGKPHLGQYDGITFFRYDNATKKMKMCESPGFDVDYDNTSYDLPRTSKDIIVTKWDDNGNKKQKKTLKWNGRRFSL